MPLIIPILLALSVGLFYVSYKPGNEWFVYSTFLAMGILFFLVYNFTNIKIPLGDWLCGLVIMVESTFCCFTKGDKALRIASFVLAGFALLKSLL